MRQIFESIDFIYKIRWYRDLFVLNIRTFFLLGGWFQRCFEKISYDQFRKDICDNKKLYDEYTLPTRSTKNSAGYDFVAINDFQIKPGEIKKIPLGIKVQMNEDEVLFLIVRSSMGF